MKNNLYNNSNSNSERFINFEMLAPSIIKISLLILNNLNYEKKYLYID